MCISWQPITYSAKDDSDETVREIVAANALIAKFCPSLSSLGLGPE